ncbi:autotransporter domain-containing protein [Acinetobacter guillouiae]|uniref:autotransporter domain-containing protein n=1 Tax=Acinetobacter guillouiae TaxID=106649 RepID=UPI0021D0F8AF|nr:autotransporter domain-containing protein [Acinetobacter guillouiae]MCU4492152.1 autotransporter domain-containing protein [Acinetobacter guillouiae]
MKRIFKEKTLSILLRSILLGYPIISSSSFAVPLRAETDEFNANWGLSRIGAQYAYEKGYTGKGISIGVADSDFPSGISELTDKLTFVTPNKDGKEHNSELSIGSKVADGFNAEDYTHGAHVSGIIGAKKNDQGMHGVAYGADIFAQHMNNNIYPFLDTTAVRLINNSWGTEGDKDYGINPGDPQWKDLIGIDGISTSTVKDFEKKSDKNRPYDFLNQVIYTTTPTKRGESKISITVKDVVEAEDGIIERNGQKFNFGANDKSNNGLVNQIRALREAGKQGVVNVFAAGNYNHYNEPGAFQGMPIVYNDLLPNYLTISNLTLVRSKEITVPEDSETLSAGDDLQFFEVTFQNKKYLRQANLAIGKEDYLWEQVGQGLRQTQILVNDDSTKETLYTGSSQCGYTALWCVAAPGTGIYSSTFKVEDGKLADNYEYMTGTSMAAPHATGALAVLMERFPYMSSSQTVSVLKTTAADMDENGRVTDGRAKVIDKYFGWGKIDLENAIKGPAMFASADDVKNMLAEDVKQNLGDDLDNLANTFGNGDFTVNMGQGIKYDIGTTRERSCDAAECSFDTWSNNIAGSGGLIKKGSGTLQLSGNNTYAGNTFINEGGIDIKGSLSSGIIVNKLGTLSGQGQSATIEINSGRFAPSLYNQTGFSTFTINGDIKFSPDATYSAKIRDKNEQVDKLVVRGNAYLNGANFQTYEQSPDKLLGKNDTLRYQGNEYTLMDATKINGIFNNNYLTSIATENIQPELTKTEEDKKLKLQFRDLTADKAAAEKAAADKAAAEKAAADKAADKAAAEKAAADKAAAEKAAAEKAAADKAAAEKAAADKAAADKAAADKAAAEKAAAEKAAAEKAAAEKAAAEKAAADKAAAEKAAADKAAVEKAAAEKAAADKAAAEKAAADKAAAEKATADQAATEKAAADKAVADQAAAEKAAAEKAAAEKAAADKATAEKAAVEKATAEKAAAEKAAAEKAAAEKAAAEKAAADKAAAEKAAAEKAAAEKTAADKAAAEKAAAEKVAADKAAADKAAAEAKLLEQARAEKATQIASIHGDILAEEFQDMDHNRRLTNQRLRYIQRNQENSNNAWIDFSDSKSKSRLGEWNNLSNAKMHDYNVQRQGLALGADTTLGDWAIGITAAINSKDLNNKNNAKAKIDNYQFGIYTGTQIDQINFRFSGTLGRNEVKSRFNDQNDGQFNAKYNGRTYQLNAEMGYALQHNNLYMEPFIGVAYDYLENDSIQQSNGYYSLNSEKTNIDRVSSTVGLDISQKWNVWDTTSLSLNASLAWQNRLKNNDKAGKLTFISNNSLIAGDAGYLDVPNNQNTGIINFGFNVDIANTHGFSVNYEGQFAKKYSENGIRLQYGYKF